MTTPIHINIQLLITDLVDQLVSTIKVIVVLWFIMLGEDILCNLVPHLTKL